MIEGLTGQYGLTSTCDLHTFPPPPSQNGAHVKVTTGQHSGATGMIVRVDGEVCYVYTDTTNQEIMVFARDITEAAAMQSAQDK